MLAHRNSELIEAMVAFREIYDATDEGAPLWLADAFQEWEHDNLMNEVRSLTGALPSELE